MAVQWNNAAQAPSWSITVVYGINAETGAIARIEYRTIQGQGQWCLCGIYRDTLQEVLKSFNLTHWGTLNMPAPEVA